MRREYRALNAVNSLPVRLEEWLSENAGRVHDVSFEDIRKLVRELRRQQMELQTQRDQLKRLNKQLEHATRWRTVELEDINEELIDELLQHKKTLDLLRESEEFNGNLLKYAAHPIQVINADNSIRYVNPAFEKLTGYSAAEIEGQKPPFPYWPEEKRQQYYRDCMDETVRQVEWLFQKKNGENFWVDLNSAPVEGNGELKYHICSWTDITERKRFEEALKASEEKFSIAFHASPVPMVISTLSEGSFIDVNGSFLEASEYSRDELIGHPSSEFMFWPDDVREQLINTIRENGKIRNIEVSFASKSGRMRQALYSAERIRLGNQECLLSAANDITERKKAEEALRQSEERFRLVTKLSPLPLSFTSERGEIEFVNDRFTSVFGYTREDIPDLETWLQKAFPDEKDRQEVLSAWEGALEKSRGMNKDSINPEIHVTCKDGAVRTVELSGTKIGNKNLAVFNDITERKQTEEALRTSDEFNLALLENAPNQVMVINPDTSVRYVNPAFVEKNGWTQDEVIGIKCPYPWWPEEEKEKLSARFKMAMQQDSGQGEVLTQKKNGERYWLALNYVSVKSNGKQKYLVINSIDITERKRTEEALRESEEHFRLLTGKAPMPMIVNGEKGEIEYVNEKFTHTFGYTLVDFSGRQDWWRLAYPDEQYRNEVQSSWRAAIEEASKENKSPEPQEYQVTCKNGSVHTVEMSSTKIGKKSVVVLNDITERRRAEKNLKLSFEKVQRALQGSIDAAAKMVEMRDPYTAGHQQKVAKLSMAIASEMNLPEEQVKYIGMAAIVHDIGKIYVPAEILSRTGKLSDLEFQMMRIHVQGSYDILKNIEFPWPIAEVVLQHHERMDGSGYPRGLKGDEIMLEARILGLADTVEAMSAHRPYRPALGVGEALEEISKNKGKLYDTLVVEACINLILEKGFRLDKE